MSVETLVEYFAELEDPRCSDKIEHRLLDILVIAICATIAGAKSWENMALYGRSQEDWQRGFLDLPNCIPAHETFRHVFMLIDPDHFEIRFEA